MLGAVSEAQIEVPANTSVTIGIPKLGLGVRYATLSRSPLYSEDTLSQPSHARSNNTVLLYVNNTAISSPSASAKRRRRTMSVITTEADVASTGNKEHVPPLSSLCVQQTSDALNSAEFLILCPVGAGVYTITFEHVHLKETEQKKQHEQTSLSKWDAHNTNFTVPVKFIGRDASTNGNWTANYGELGYVLFNFSSSAAAALSSASSSAAALTTDLVKLPKSVANVWAAGAGQEDTRGGAPLSGHTGRRACKFDGPFQAEGPVTVDNGRFGSCVDVWTVNASDPRVPVAPSTAKWVRSTKGGVGNSAGSFDDTDVVVPDNLVVSGHGHASTAQWAHSAAGISASGWKGSFHVDIELASTNTPLTISLYFLDFKKWDVRQVVKVLDLESGSTVAECVLAENFSENGLYLRYRVTGTRKSGSQMPVMPKGIRFRIHQVHSEAGDKQGWAPPPLLSAIFFD
jgi:hypothetical protein